MKKLAEAAKVKNKSVPASKRTCKFNPYFCTCIGHNSAALKECEMHGKSKAEKDMALSEIKVKVLAAEISKMRCECKSGMITHTILKILTKY